MNPDDPKLQAAADQAIWKSLMTNGFENEYAAEATRKKFWDTFKDVPQKTFEDSYNEYTNTLHKQMASMKYKITSGTDKVYREDLSGIRDFLAVNFPTAVLRVRNDGTVEVQGTNPAQEQAILKRLQDEKLVF